MENIKYTIGQRWYSQTEPELGLGIITELEDKYLSILFPLCQEARKYNANSHPLKRYKLEINDSTLDLSGNDQVVKDFQVKDNLYYYQLGSEIICETQLDAKIDLSGAKERLFSGNSDPLEYYRLRYETQLLKRKYQEFPYKHFLSEHFCMFLVFLCFFFSLASRFAFSLFLKTLVLPLKTTLKALLLRKICSK